MKKETIFGFLLGAISASLIFVGIWGICQISSRPKEDDVLQKQVTIPRVLAIRQVKHMSAGDVGWVNDNTVWVDGQSKVWIVNDAVISDKKPEAGNPIKVSFVEKRGFCLEVSSFSKWKVGEYSTYQSKSYPIVEMKIYEHDKK